MKSHILTFINDNNSIVTGDTKQTDLDGRKLGTEGLSQALNVFKNMESFASVHFTKYDIVRGEFCKQWIIASENLLHITLSIKHHQYQENTILGVILLII